MLLKPLTLAAGLLAVPATQAFLLPPEVTDAEIDVANAIDIAGAEITQRQAVDLECPDCPILVKGRRGRPIQLSSHHRTSHLQLTFTIDHQPDHDRLLVNDFELFPAGDPLGQVLLAPQTVDWGKEKGWGRHHREHDHHDGERREGGRRKHHDHEGDEHREHDQPEGGRRKHHDHEGDEDREHDHHNGDRPKHDHGDDEHREDDHHDGGHPKHDHGDDEHRHHGDDGDEHRRPDQHDGERRKRPHRLTPQPQRLGFGLHVAPGKKDAESPFDFIEVELQVLEVGVAFVDNIPNLKIKLIKDGEGRLLMSAIEKTQPKKLVTLPGTEPEECTTVMCKLAAIREMLRQKLENLRHFNSRPCAGRPRPEFPLGAEVPEFHHGPHHHHPHGPGAEEWPARFREHRWGKLFKHIASHILLPVLIGIVAGVSISLIGMAVGTMVVSLWRVFFRRGHGHRHHHHGHHRRRSSRSNHQHKAARKEAAFEDEKSGLMEHQDPPPEYVEEEEAAKVAQV